MILASDVLTRCARVLNDEEYVRWTKPELLAWLSDAMAEIAVRRPASFTTTATVELVDGVMQTLPEGAVQLFDVIATGMRPISRVDRRLMDDTLPQWRAEPRTSRVRHYMYDEAAPRQFRVYPPARAGTVLEVMYGAIPPAPTTDTDEIPLDREYISPLVSFILYRAHSKDSEYAQGQVATLHYQAFSEALGIRNESAGATSPNGTSQ